MSCVSFEAEPGPCPKAALLFFGGFSLVSVSPPFPGQQLFEPALWNLGKVMEAETYFLQTRNRRHKQASVARSPTRSCLVSRGNQEKGNIAANKVLSKGVPSQMGLVEDTDFYEEVTSDHQ